MPFVPELFTAPTLARLEEKGHVDELVAVPYFDGLMAGAPDALVESFAAEPELLDPVYGRVKGTPAFRAFVTEMNAWMVRHNVSVEDVEHVVTERRGFEEVVLHLDGETGPVDLPVTVVADREADGRIDELRIYFSSWPLTGRQANRPPLLEPDPELRESDIIAVISVRSPPAMPTRSYRRSKRMATPASRLAADTSTEGEMACAPSTSCCSRTTAASRSNTARSSTTSACVLDYNVVRWGNTKLPPQAGVAVYVQGQSGKIAATRIYDDADPPDWSA